MKWKPVKEMRYAKTVLIALAVVGLMVPVSASQRLPDNVIVIKDSRTELTNAVSVKKLLESRDGDLKIHDLDAVDQFERSVGRHLPSNEEKAREAFENYVDRVGREAFEQQAMNAYRCIMAAVRYQVKAYPAVIFDGNSVVYGVTDLAEALARYQRWKAEQDGSQ